MTIKLFGVDISEHNGNVDFAKMKASGVKYVMLRTSWGHFAEDKLIRRNVQKCKEAGLPYGFYHYSYAATDQNAKEEAAKFLALCNELGGYTYPLNLDMEDADGWKARNGVSDAQNLRTIKIFKDVIEGAGKYLTLYMSKSWFDRLRAKDKALIDSIDPWLAHWGIDKPSMDCGMWQYSSDGVIPGSSARTDVNWCYKDYPAIIKGNTSKPSKPNTLPGSILDLVVDVMRGKYGNGATRRNKLGARYNEVQGFIDHIASASVDTLVKEVKEGKFGNGEIRKIVLGDKYNAVQGKIDNTASKSRPTMSAKQFALEVWNQGKHGTGETRKSNAKRLGVDYQEAQRLISILANGGKI